MKKIIAVLMALAVLVLFTSCLSSGEDVGPKEGRGVPTLGVGNISSSSSNNDDTDEPVGGLAECTGLTDADMKALIANYNDIMDALDDLGADYTEADYDTVFEDVEDILASYGISGPNRFNKLIMAHYCELCLAYDEEMKKDFTTALTMKAMGIDPIAEYRTMVNDEDYKVVKANHKAFKKVVEAR